MKRRPSTGERRGIALVVTAGILTILAAMGMALVALSHASAVGATRYSDMVRADFMARAGIADAISRLRAQAFEKPEDSGDPWFRIDYLDGLRERISFAAGTGGPARCYSRALSDSLTEDGDRYALSVSDAAGRINLNAGDNLAVLLDNLCRLIGPPLVAAHLEALQPRRWAEEGAPAHCYELTENREDTPDRRDLCFRAGADGRPVLDAQGLAFYGDGYAIAGYRARHGLFTSIDQVREALTYVERNGNGRPDDALEQLELALKFAALKEHITVDSWVDATTVGVGKFEWSGPDFAIDREKSWIPGDLSGSYVSIVNGHGAGQLRRIKANGIDWIEVEGFFTVPPGPLSSYLIVAREDAATKMIGNAQSAIRWPETDADGNLQDDPEIDYLARPLCIHRAPVNLNTASDKVLAALFMGLNVQHGHALAIGTDADLTALQAAWFAADARLQEPYLLTKAGVKRLPSSSGRILFDRPRPAQALSPQFDYIDNQGAQAGWNEAQELALRVILARQATDASGKALGPDPFTGYARGPFRSWDDLFCRVVKPWDVARGADPRKTSVARVLMANANPNTDLLKFNPNIEWIDRWGRNFTELEPVMIYEDLADPVKPVFVPAFATPPADPDPDRLDAHLPVSLWPYQLCKYGVFDPVAKAIRKPAAVDWGAYAIRSMRYRSTDLIDKSDLNRSTTECCFDSGGIYEVLSTGQVFGPYGIVAERRLEACVKIYDVWRESTQEQFVKGTIDLAAGSTGTSAAGQVARGMIQEASTGRSVPNVSARLALTTLPEPLVPPGYRLKVNKYYKDVVDSSATGTDAFGREKVKEGNEVLPDIVANEVLPARYDGQLVLATNTASYNPADAVTFLASFNGDLDTDTCRGNGREQAKTPGNRRIRCVDTIGLLGRLNDAEVDFDPAPIGARGSSKDPAAIYAFDPFCRLAGAPMRPLNPACYWENVTCRMGDLRADGVWLGHLGGSAKDACLKYKFHHNGEGGMNYLNYNPDEGTAGHGSTICLWFKPAWHCTDGREHEFFNADNKGSGFDARFNVLTKAGRYLGACKDNGWAGGTLFSENCLAWAMEDADDSVAKTYIHGGRNNPVPGSTVAESPAYRTQPFRWSFIGTVNHYWFRIDAWEGVFGSGNRKAFGFSVDTEGYTAGSDWRNPVSQEILGRHARPFICTARGLEGEGFKLDAGGARPSTRYMWGFCALQMIQEVVPDPDNPGQTLKVSTGVVDPQIRYPDIGMGTEAKQQLAWFWQDGKKDSACFSINALNEKPDGWVYRSLPTDGTMAVIDEFKICSGRMWDSARIRREMEVSRYYLPAQPGDRAQCPTFTSQPLLQSVRGRAAQEAGGGEYVTVARVTWSVFTPRFMIEQKSQACTRMEYIRNGNALGDDVVPTPVAFRGPFDYVEYNRGLGLPEEALNPVKPALGVDRPTGADYQAAGFGQPHATRGVEVELLDGATPLAGQYLNATTGRFADAEGEAKSIFRDPDATNRLGSAGDPVRVRADRLRYRVRFRYEIDPLVKRAHDPEAALTLDEAVDPGRHYLLDTPVFDDISIIYFAKARIRAYRELAE